MRHHVAITLFCSYYFNVSGGRERCVGESKCALTAPSSSSFLRPPHSPPSLSLSGLCAALFIWAVVGLCRHSGPDDDCAPASVVALKLSRDGGWQGNNAGVNTTYRTVISVSAQQGDIHTLLGWVVNRVGAPRLNYNHTHTHTHTLSCVSSDIVDWGFDVFLQNLNSLFFLAVYHLTINHRIKVTLDSSH